MKILNSNEVIVLEENVLVIEADSLNDVLNEEGLLNIELDTIKKSIIDSGSYIPRSKAEIDERYRQVIPYVVMKTDKQYLLMKRTDKQGEKRLHNKLSLGVGGHVNDEDKGENTWQVFLRGMERELREEVEAEIKSLRYIGVINEVNSPVSRVHIGLAYVAEVDFKGLNEPDLFEIEWQTLEELRERAGKMEGWSKLVLEKL